jgi:hypothetical protein
MGFPKGRQLTRTMLPAQPASMSIAVPLSMVLMGPVQDRDAALNTALNGWVAMWNSYDLDEVDRPFVADEGVSYSRRSARD